MDIKDQEKAAVGRHVTEAREHAVMWEESLKALLECFRIVDTAKLKGANKVRFGLLLTAWNHLMASYDLAVRGYFGPALALLRMGRDSYLAAWYLVAEPKEWRKFAYKKYQAERFEARKMANSIRSFTLKYIESQNNKTKQEIKQEKQEFKKVFDGFFKHTRVLNDFNHVNGRMLSLAFVDNRPKGSGSSYWVGPRADPAAFGGVAFLAALILSYQATAMSVLYDLMQIKELAALQDLETRILNYMESQRKFPSWKKRTAAEERGGQ